MGQSTAVFVGIGGAVVALDRATGQEVWRAKLSSDFVNVVLDEGELYAATKGELFCMDPTSGQVRWHNPLKGLGRGLVTIASPGGGSAVVVREKRRREEAAAASAATVAAT